MASQLKQSRPIESLEPRRLLAGTVRIVETADQIKIIGDASANHVLVERTTSRGAIGPQILVSDLDGGQVVQENGGPFDFARINLLGRPVRILLDAGDDTLTVRGSVFRRRSLIDLGSGNDSVSLHRVRATGSLDIRAGDGDDRMRITASRFQGRFEIVGGAGKDRVSVDAVQTENSVRIADTSGPSRFYISRLSASGQVSFRTGESRDRISVQQSQFAQRPTIEAAGGDDRITYLNNNQLGNLLDGNGADVVDDGRLSFNYDFNTDDTQGWTFGAGDYFLVPGELSLDDYNLQSGIRSVKVDPGRTATGYYMQGRNISDQLMLYITRPFGKTDGLKPGAKYRLIAEMGMATGLTDSSALGVIFAGVTGVPQVVQYNANTAPNTFEYYLFGSEGFALIDSRSREADGVARLAAPEQLPGEPTLNGMYAADFTHELQNEVVADKNGVISPVVAVKSGFEEFFYQYILYVKLRFAPVV
jgi:hypothetical protein